jgi:soluble lytic murein transglycosylase
VGTFTLVFPTKYANFVEKYSKLYGVDKNLVYAVIRCESGFDLYAKSKKGAVGLMQLMPSTALWCANKLNENYTDERLYDPEFNIKIGVYYLAYLHTVFSCVDEVIMAYNAGEGNVKKWLNEEGSIFSETATYLKRVKFCIGVYKLKSVSFRL